MPPRAAACANPMKLAKAFFRLPVRFDTARLRAEVAALPAEAWAKHPNDIRGNTSLRLISVNGGENDEVDGVMLTTPHLAQSPYLRQVLASFGVVWSRSRLLKLAPFAGVPPHADINYHWFNRVRLHIPIVTHPDVRFFCGDDVVHMAAGEAWIFDNWRLHRVENPVDAERVHLVADTSGSASFWQFVAQSELPAAKVHEHRYDPGLDAQPLTEHTALRPVMPPAEVDLLLLDLQAELMAAPGTAERDPIARYCGLLDAFRRDWRQLYQLFGESPPGWAEFGKLRDSVRLASKEQAERLTLRTNRIAAHTVLEGRVLRPMLTGAAVQSPQHGGPPNGGPPIAGQTTVPQTSRPHVGEPQTTGPEAIGPHAGASQAGGPSAGGRRGGCSVLERPIFIVAAPRSGSTLLFETLAASEQVATVGGEAHWLVESIPQLRPGAPGVDSNRLGAEHCTPGVSELIVRQIAAHLQDHRGQPSALDAPLRFLEKTPKNALRVPFFDRLFPDALFIFLWRDPHQNLSSIMQAWRSGNWKTYNGLEEFDGPWSLLLPPGWPRLRGKSLQEIAAFQWESTNRILLEDLGALPRARWCAVSYADLVSNPPAAIRRLCDFAGIAMDGPLRERLAGALPLSRFTQTAPTADKWRRNEAEVLSVMPAIQDTWRRLEELG
jgi:hypothetical protein